MKIDIRLDGHKHSIIDFSKSQSIAKMMKGTTIDRDLILSYKINHTQYVNEDYLLTEDTYVNCITARHPEGSRIYQDTAIFILGKALNVMLGDTHNLVAEHSIGDGVFCEVFHTERFTEEDCAKATQLIDRKSVV